MDREQQPSKQPAENRPERAGDRFLQILGADPDNWNIGAWCLALLAIGIGLSIVIIAVCGYVFEWGWTGLTKPKQRTFWDWLSLLLVPVVLALGGYLFTRSENRRTQDIAAQQRALDRQIADERRQDDTLQAYLDGMAQLLTDKDRPLHRSQLGDSLSSLARARTLTVLPRLDGDRKARVVQFLYESGLIASGRPTLALSGADLSGADLLRANLSGADLSGASLRGASLSFANLSYTDLREADLREAELLGANLSGADLLGANLLWALVIRADLRGANLIEVDLGEADLREADLRGAYLIEAYLSGADLSEANLSEADLSRAYLGGANLIGTNLSEADLREATRITNEQLDQQAKSLKAPPCPTASSTRSGARAKVGGRLRRTAALSSRGRAKGYPRTAGARTL